VTATVAGNGTLYAYEQAPGATTWRRQVIETMAQNGGVGIGLPSVTATATSVQVVTQDLAYGTPAITWTGDNLLVAAVQDLSGTKHRLDFWWQGSTFSNFNRETVTTVNNPVDLTAPAMVSTSPNSGGETVITAPLTRHLWGTSALVDWTQPTGSPAWTKHQIAGP